MNEGKVGLGLRSTPVPGDVSPMQPPSGARKVYLGAASVARLESPLQILKKPSRLNRDED